MATSNWTHGSSLMSDIVQELKVSGVSLDDRVVVYDILINAFQSYDCFTLDECMGIDRAYDAAYKSINNDEEIDIEEDEDEEFYDDNYEDGT